MFQSSTLELVSTTSSFFPFHNYSYHTPLSQASNHTYNQSSNIDERYSFIKNLTTITDDFYDVTSFSPESSNSLKSKKFKHRKKQNKTFQQQKTTETTKVNYQSNTIVSYNDESSNELTSKTSDDLVTSSNMKRKKSSEEVNKNSNLTTTSYKKSKDIRLNGTARTQTDSNIKDLRRRCMMFSSFWNICIVGSLNIFGFIGNTLSIMVLNRDKNNRVPTFLLQTLAIFDNVVLFVSFCVLFYANGIMLWTKYDLLRDIYPYIIKYINPVGLVGQTCVIWTTVLLAINRFFAVCRPFSAKKNLTMFRARMQVAAVVITTVLLCIPVLMRKNIFQRPRNLLGLPPCSQPPFFNASHSSYNVGKDDPLSSNKSDEFVRTSARNSAEDAIEKLFYEHNCTSTDNLSNPCLKKHVYTRSLKGIEIGSLIMHEKINFHDLNYVSNSSLNLDQLNNTRRNCSNDRERFPSIRPSKLGSNAYFVFFYYQIIFNFLTVGLPISLLIALNIPIIYTIRNSKRMMQQSSTMYRGTQEKNITIVMTIIIFELLICHIPDRILVVYTNSFPANYLCPHPVFFLQFIFNLLVLMNSSSDFIIYYIFRCRFRNILKNEMCSKVTRRLSSYQRTPDINLLSKRHLIIHSK